MRALGGCGTQRTSRSRAVWGFVLAAVAVVGAACGGGGSDEPSAAPAESTAAGDDERTAWDKVLEGIGDDGSVDRQTALQAFSLAVAPLPGVDVPDGRSEPIPDGSGAVAWTLRRFDELTGAQQRAIGEALGAGIASSDDATGQSLRVGDITRDVRLAAAPSAPRGCYGQPVATADSPGAERYRALVDEMIDAIGARLGGRISMNLATYVVLERREAPGDTSYAFTWIDPGDCSQNTGKTCTIHFNPAAQAVTGDALRGIVAHEVMHCYVFAHLGVHAYDLPPWIGEGIPAWVGETIANGTTVSTKWWRRYLTNPGKALFGRDYDAIGFYGHLDETGTDPWPAVVPVLDAFDNEPAWEASTGSRDEFLDSWASGFAREPGRGDAWDTAMAGITSDKPSIPRRAIGAGQSLTESATRVSTRIVGLAIAAPVVVVTSESSGRIAGAGSDVLVKGVGPLCTLPEGCRCPEGSDGEGTEFTVVPDPELLTVSGGLETGTVRLQAMTLEDFCGKRKKPATSAPPASTVDSCLVGSWVSTNVVITDEVTGAPATELGGGDGITMRVTRSGDVTVDHAGMHPIRTDVAGNVFELVISGVGHARIEAVDGKLTVVENDFATTTQGVVRGGPLSSRPIPGTPVLGSGSYECSADALRLSYAYPLGTSVSTFTRSS